MLRFIVHYGIHFLVPILIALIIYRRSWLKSSLILLGGIIIDIDHIWADPIFDPNRCSINYHPLHTYPFIILYTLLLFRKQTRIFGIALLIHIIADTTDCLML
ncbi:DUF6122 family protein [Zhouia spongiae]|uniref:DUF6122 family protein n=1 Tax=Zhouia spongiae TaxID=2202721 RepID=A0ABY3YMT5_9FLAO|nr:DUF6122 family protein [Zhouia spongiae]UNY98811.1 DUF6122 family protein [Zhouia spongiae]